MAPDASNTAQLKHTLLKAKTFLGQLCYSSLTARAHWVATQTVVEPGVLYPLMAIFYSLKEIEAIQCVLSQLQCQSLGLNRNFPRVLLHGPMTLGGLGVPSVSHKITAIRINYFLYNLRTPSPTAMKLEISILISQLEIGIFNQFLAEPYDKYGSLASPTLCTQIWRETEPFGLQLRASPEAIWTPSHQGHNDIPIIDLVL